MRQIKYLLAVTFSLAVILSCSTSNNNQKKSNFVEGKGYCVHKYGDNGCLCTYGDEDWVCQDGPKKQCEDNKSKAGQCTEYVPDLDEWEAKQRKEADNAGQSASISND